MGGRDPPRPDEDGGGLKLAEPQEWASSDRWRTWLHGAHARTFALPSMASPRNAPFALFIVCILGYGAAIAWYTLDRFDLVNLIRDGYGDDAFYYFQIAYHMAEGRFSTFDGVVTRTNGYHPLWLFLLTPFYWLFDKTEALFAVKAFEIMLVAGGVALVAAAARVARLPWILLFAALPALYAQPGMLVGMEAALVLFMLGSLMLATCLFARDPARWRWPLAAVAFALPWARLEWAAVAVAVAAALCFFEWAGRFRCASSAAVPEGSSSHRHTSSCGLQAAVPLAAAFAGVLVYFVYNGIVFGGIVPVSGAVKALWAQQLWAGGYSLAGNFNAFAHSEAFDDELLIALEICAYALLVWWLSRRFRTREGGLLLAFMVGAFGLAAGHLAKFLQNVLFMHPYFGLFEWYFVPAYLMEALVVPVRCFVGIYVFRCALAVETRGATDILCLAGGVAVGVVLLAKTDFAAPFRFVDEASAATNLHLDLHSYMGVQVMNRLLPENASVGSWDSGVVGYFAKFPVINLDGLANSYDYKQAMENSPVGVFDKQLGLSHFGNHFAKHPDIGPSVAMQLVPPGLLAKGRPPLFETQAAGTYVRELGGYQFKLYGVSDVAAPPWNSIASRFERQADGTGLLVQGRLAQAFAEECADEVAEWTFGGKVGAISHWTQTVSGCASAVVLPHGHRPPVHVRSAGLGEAVAGLTGETAPASRTNAGAPDGFEVHLVGRRLVYAKENCEQDDIEMPVFLHLHMTDEDAEDDESAKTSHVNHDFWFEVYGGWDPGGAEGPCVADVPLPPRPIAAVSTGQQNRWGARIPVDLERSADGVGSLVVGKEARAFATECAAKDVAAWTYRRWRAQGVDALDQTAGRGRRISRRVLHRQDERAISGWTRTADGSCTSAIELPLGHLPPVRVRRAPLTEALAGLGGGRPPAIGAASTHPRGFDVYLFANYARRPSCPNCSRTLVYAKEACEQADVETPFFLHLVPAGDDFDAGRESTGFNNLDFRFHGAWSGEDGSACLAEVPLPEYDVARIRTGQYTAGGTVWEGEVRLIQPTAEALADLTGGRSPAIRAGSTTPRGFDVYFVGNILVYAKEACEQADVEAPFFLHLVPAGDDFDAGRESAGFNNRDFWFRHYGDWSGEEGSACLAEVPLPAYGIAKIRTGQYTAAGIAWEGEVHPHQLTTEGI